MSHDQTLAMPTGIWERLWPSRITAAKFFTKELHSALFMIENHGNSVFTRPLSPFVFEHGNFSFAVAQLLPCSVRFAVSSQAFR